MKRNDILNIQPKMRTVIGSKKPSNYFIWARYQRIYNKCHVGIGNQGNVWIPTEKENVERKKFRKFW